MADASRGFPPHDGTNGVPLPKGQAQQTPKLLNRDPSSAERILDALDRPDFRSLDVRLAAFLALGETASGHPLARPGDCSLVTTGLEEILVRWRRRFETGDQATTDPFFAAVDRFRASAIKNYGGEFLRLEILRARAFWYTGQPAACLAAIAPWSEHPCRIEGGFFQTLDVFELDLLARTALGQVDEVASLALGRAHLVTHMRPHMARTVFRRMGRFLGVIAADQSLLGDAIRHCARFELRAKRGRRGWVQTRILKIAGWAAGLAGSAALLLLARQRRLFRVQLGSTIARQPRALTPGEAMLAGADAQPLILVSRPMGGLGDIAMMLPGLVALSQKFGRRTAFAIPKKFHALFDAEPAIELLDSDSFIDLGNYQAWYHLGDCPAARYESRVTPNIRKGRVELFARGMGLRASAIGLGRLPPEIRLNADQEKSRAAFRAEWEQDGRKRIAIGLHSRETYRDYPHMAELMLRLAEDYSVLAIHHRPVTLPVHPHIHGFFGRPLSELTPALAACDALVSVDTALLHFCGSFGLPTIAITGPTSGRIRTLHLPLATCVEADDFACRPCWRNEDQPCLVTGDYTSACLQALAPEVIVARLKLRLAAPNPGTAV